MLRLLHVKNVALIDELELSFEPGLNVITGETGAGKSLLMHAIGLALGSRATGDMIRRGTSGSVVEAVFGVNAQRAAHLRVVHGLPVDDELVVRRLINNDSGRSRVYVNGALSTLGVLRKIIAGLMQIYGQHEQHVLREADSGLPLLDDFAETAEQVAEMTHRYRALRVARQRVHAFVENRAAAAAKQELVRFQVDEIRRAALHPAEDDALRQERAILVNAEKLYHTAAEGEEALVGDDAVTDRLGRVVARLRELVQVDDSLAEVVGMLNEGMAQIEEAGLILRRYAERLGPNPERLDEVDTRLALISQLKKKYGGTLQAVLVRQQELERELEDIAGGDEALAALEREAAQAADAAWTWAAALSDIRRRAAARLEQRVTAELAQLGMQGARFAVRFDLPPAPDGGSAAREAETSGEDRLGERGCDRVEFQLSANPGEPLLPLGQVASGGELSRLMLALKALSAAAGATPTLIFDEVDAGIGGGVAEVVGRRLKTLAAQHQVLCITHLPQIAAFADHAYTVTKNTNARRTVSSAKRLSDAERLQELARMLGGVEVSNEARRHARDMLARARRVDSPGGRP